VQQFAELLRGTLDDSKVERLVRLVREAGPRAGALRRKDQRLVARRPQFGVYRARLAATGGEPEVKFVIKGREP
jgi:hypothetical protein